MSKCVRGGFTLIELSIVLVIIGLVVGGILFGRDLIAAAQARLVIKQFEQYDLAIITFKEKYKALPGDIKNPSDYGFSGTAGNNDGCISVCYDSFVSTGSYLMSTFQAFNEADQGFEIPNVWRQLGEAKLIPGTYDGQNAYFDEKTIGGTIPQVASHPQSGWVAYTTPEILGPATAGMQSAVDPNVVRLAGPKNFISMFEVAMDWGQSLRPPLEQNHGLPPSQAKRVDDKIDDGNPGTGRAKAYYSDINAYGGYDWYLDTTYLEGVYFSSPYPSTPQRDGLWCAYVPSGTTWVYNTGDEKASCGLRIRASF